MKVDHYRIFPSQYNHIDDVIIEELYLFHYNGLNIHINEKKIHFSGNRAFSLLLDKNCLRINFAPIYRICDFHNYGKPYGLYRGHDGTLFKKFSTRYKDEAYMKKRRGYLDETKFNTEILEQKIEVTKSKYASMELTYDEYKYKLEQISKWYLIGYYDMLDRMKRHANFLMGYYKQYRSCEYVLSGVGIKYLKLMTIVKSPRLSYNNDAINEEKVITYKVKQVSSPRLGDFVINVKSIK
jgi:hypothetical protein